MECPSVTGDAEINRLSNDTLQSLRGAEQTKQEREKDYLAHALAGWALCGPAHARPIGAFLALALFVCCK